MVSPALIAALRCLSRINETLSEAGRTLAGLLLVLMLGSVILQVFFRYVLNDSLVWTEEFSKAMMVWSAFLVAPIALRRGSNVAIAMLVLPLPARMQALIRLAIDLAIIAVLIAFLNESFGFVARGRVIVAASVDLPMAVFYAIVPIGLSALLLTAFELMIRDLLTIEKPDGRYLLPAISPIREGE